MIHYFDPSNVNGAVGFLPDKGDQVVFTGTEIHREAEKYRALGEPFAKDLDIHFWFGQEGPEETFYTVPRMEIMAHDSQGGYFALLPDDTCLYIDSEKQAFRLPGQFPKLPADWRNQLEPASDIHFFPSREKAEQEFPIQDFPEFPRT